MPEQLNENIALYFIAQRGPNGALKADCEMQAKDVTEAIALVALLQKLQNDLIASALDAMGYTETKTKVDKLQS